MEIDTDENEYFVKGGDTILGKIAYYQHITGLSPVEILKLPYIQFVIGLMDMPQVDYKKKREKKNGKSTKKSKLTQEEELAIIAGAFR